MRILSILLLLFFACGKIQAQIDYNKLNEKAERFIQFQEWRNANAMYLLMLDNRNDDFGSYSRAIVTSGLIGDRQSQLDLLERTQKAGIPLDSIFSQVRVFSFDIGEYQEYERFLKLVKHTHSWLARPINMRLLKYYDFRNDAPNMVSIGQELLVATPNEVNYLGVVARGFVLMGDFENGADVYERILSIDDKNYEALIAMGNYFYVMWKAAEGTRSQLSDNKQKSLEYFHRADKVHSTPYVTSVINELSE